MLPYCGLFGHAASFLGPPDERAGSDLLLRRTIRHRNSPICCRVWQGTQEEVMQDATSSELKPHALIASDRVEGTDVRRVNGEKIGRIERVMIDKISGNVAYAVLTFGGLLRFGEKH